MARNKSDPSPSDDWLWGFGEIGRAMGNRTEDQVRRSYARGFLKGAVRKLGHRTVVGSRNELAKLVTREALTPDK
jgi:hypothetical protein